MVSKPTSQTKFPAWRFYQTNGCGRCWVFSVSVVGKYKAYVTLIVHERRSFLSVWAHIRRTPKFFTVKSFLTIPYSEVTQRWPNEKVSKYLRFSYHIPMYYCEYMGGLSRLRLKKRIIGMLSWSSFVILIYEHCYASVINRAIHSARWRMVYFNETDWRAYRRNL